LFDTRSGHGMVGFVLARLVGVALQTCLKCYTFGTKKMKNKFKQVLTRLRCGHETNTDLSVAWRK
jgi:hypothetical protein